MNPRAPALLSLMLLAGCAVDTSPTHNETPHGYVEGAEEAAEPQTTLVISDAAGEAAYTLDPTSEDVTEVNGVHGNAVATDGRYVYFAHGDHGTVFDSGTWTVDHDDHVHYYRAAPSIVGELDVAVHAANGDTATTVLDGANHSTVLDREQLDEGEIDQVDGDTAVAILDGHLLHVTADGAVEVRDKTGEQIASVEDSCAEPAGHATTRLGTVLGCGESAILVSGDAEDPQAETVDYSGTRDTLGHRPTSPVFTALGDGEVELVNFAESKAVTLDVDDPLAATATGEDSPALALEGDGTLRAFDPKSGEATADTALLNLDDNTDVSITVDKQRAYVTDPRTQAVHEIDYRDDLRVSRTFPLDFTPGAMVETGW